VTVYIITSILITASFIDLFKKTGMWANQEENSYLGVAWQQILFCFFAAFVAWASNLNEEKWVLMTKKLKVKYLTMCIFNKAAIIGLAVQSALVVGMEGLCAAISCH
jgi:hypothetical protein